MLAADTKPEFFGAVKDLSTAPASSAESETARSFVFVISILWPQMQVFVACVRSATCIRLQRGQPITANPSRIIRRRTGGAQPPAVFP